MVGSRASAASYRLAFGLALITAAGFTLTPEPVPLPQVPQADKWAHLATYLTLAFLADASWPERGFDWRKWALLIGYGMLIELAQSQIPNRDFSTADMLANTAGIALYEFFARRALRAMGTR